MSIKVFQRPVGPLQMNATLVMDRETKDAVFFDPGDNTESLLEIAKKENMIIKRLIATHCHIDHIADANKAMKLLNLPLEISPLGIKMLENVGPIAASFGYTISEIKASRFLNEGDTVKIGMHKFEVLHCPGHSPDSLCFYNQGTLIGGDVIFKGAIGRTDLPGGNTNELMKSIEDKILQLPDDTIIYSGHGPQTTLGYEKKHNPYINGTVKLI